MEKGTLRTRIDSWKNMADIFLKADKKVYIKDFNEDYYFADILLVGEDTIMIQCFSPKDREGKKFTLYWASIKRFEEYREFQTAKELENE